MDRSPPTATSEENEELIENMICSQEKNPRNQILSREIGKYTGISHSSVKLMVKRNKLKKNSRVSKCHELEKVRRKRKNSPKTPVALKIAFHRMKKILLLKFLSIHKAALLM